MLAILAVIAPIFALVLAGWLARRSGALGEHATRELNRFVVALALPALLFDIVATAHPAELWQPGFTLVFGATTLALFGAVVLVRRRAGIPLGDAAVEGLDAAYPNTGFMGFPLMLAVFGRAGLAPTLIAVILTVCLLFALAIVLIEIGVQTEPAPLRLARKVAAALARNPLLVAPVLGAVFPAAGWMLPAPAEQFVKLLGAAASPCALVTLGLFLAERRAPVSREIRTVATLTVLKLLAHPALTWALATWLLHLPAATTRAAVLLAALPTGTGPFMLAEAYRREASVTARVILFSTLASMATLTVYLALSG